MEGTYKIWKSTMWVWVVLMAIILALGIAVLAVGEAPLIGKAIGVGAAVVFFGGVLFVWLREMNARREVLSMVKASIRMPSSKKGYWYWATDPDLPDDAWERISSALGNIVAIEARMIADEVARRLSTAVDGISMDTFMPHVFVIFKLEGTVRAYGPNGWITRKGFAKRRGHWLEVTYYPDDLETTMSLVRHELAHAFLMHTFPLITANEQEDIMSKVGL